jgi:hypothetical protein
VIDKATLFETWAPSGGTWSGWTKPVLFAHWPRELPKLGVLPPADASWAPPVTERRALLVELPGVEAVAMALSLAEAGYRPVLVFNASPPPTRPRHPREPSPELPAAVDVESILAAIVEGAERLRNIKVPESAPPSFVIDQARSNPMRPIREGTYDNRSWVYTTDFPSAELLRTEGITGLVLYWGPTGCLAPDLEHVLRVWARHGLDVFRQPIRGGPPQPLRLARPSWFTGVKLWMKGLLLDPIRGHGSFVSG